MTDQPDQPKLEDFEAPPEEIEGAEGIFPEVPAAAAAQAAARKATPELAPVSAAPSALLEARDAVDELLGRRASAEPATLAAESLAGPGNIQGVAISVGDELSSLKAGATPGDSTLTVYVAEPASIDEVRSVLVDSLGVKAAGDEVPIQVVVSGLIEAYRHDFRERPAPGGISISNADADAAASVTSAGTLGCLCFGRQEPRNARVMILSNNHVIAALNTAAAGNVITQPGTLDTGASPADQIAVLERFVPLDFAGPNVVDCATGWAWPDRVRVEQVFVSGGTRSFFRTGNQPVAPALGMEVGKSGRTTELTKGRIDSVGGSFSVNYGTVVAPRIAHFQDTLAIRGLAGGGAFSDGGDSGSLVWQWGEGVAPVGLLFAGTPPTSPDPITFANRIEHVMAALDIWLYT